MAFVGVGMRHAGRDGGGPCNLHEMSRQKRNLVIELAVVVDCGVQDGAGVRRKPSANESLGVCHCHLEVSGNLGWSRWERSCRWAPLPA